jgi:nitrite reductase/ring-hydroxylating ferredoxin subunit
VTEIRVCSFDAVPEGDGLLAVVDGTSIGVFRLQGEIHAYENRCPHQGGPVCTGIITGRLVEDLDEEKAVIGERLSEDEIHLVCPWHGFEYRLSTGECAADPAYRLRRVPARVVDGEVILER